MLYLLFDSSKISKESLQYPCRKAKVALFFYTYQRKTSHTYIVDNLYNLEYIYIYIFFTSGI